MSYYDYTVGRELSRTDPPFNALIQAAMRKADSDNAEKLKGCWPEVWKELNERYRSPGGLLEGEE